MKGSQEEFFKIMGDCCFEVFLNIEDGNSTLAYEDLRIFAKMFVPGNEHYTLDNMRPKRLKRFIARLICVEQNGVDEFIKFVNGFKKSNSAVDKLLANFKTESDEPDSKAS